MCDYQLLFGKGVQAAPVQNSFLEMKETGPRRGLEIQPIIYLCSFGLGKFINCSLRLLHLVGDQNLIPTWIIPLEESINESFPY